MGANNFLIKVLLTWFCFIHSMKYTVSQSRFDDIYDGEHLRDVLFSPHTGRTLRHAVLIVHSSTCQVEAWRRMHRNSEFPSDIYLHFAVHDYNTSQRYTWYKWRPEDDILASYNINLQCISVGFLPKGSGEETKLVFLDDHDDFKDWLWDRMKVDITLVNEAKETVVFRFHGKFKHFPKVELAPGEKQDITVYTSYLVTAKGEQGFYGGWTIGYVAKVLSASQVTDQITTDQFISEQESLTKKRLEMLHLQRWSDLGRHLLNRKQPLLVRNITKAGYLKLPMPKWLSQHLLEFYNQHAQFREMEPWRDGDTTINMEQQKCGMVYLDTATRAVIASGMRLLLEEWCNCSLTMSAFYGIREYYKGHILKHHVDIVSTHVISVILQVAQDLDNGPDWELEVMTFEGDRQNVQLQAGEMLFYESARLIHGRPKPFKGKLMANAFLHFKPTQNWFFDKLDNEIYCDGEMLAPIYPLQDKLTLSALEKRNKKEVCNIARDLKDEL